MTEKGEFVGKGAGGEGESTTALAASCQWHKSLRTKPRPGDDAACLAHVLAIFISEVLKHHFLFPRGPQDVEGGEGEESRPAGKPVAEHQGLGDGEEEDGGVHGMSNEAI